MSKPSIVASAFFLAQMTMMTPVCAYGSPETAEPTVAQAVDDSEEPEGGFWRIGPKLGIINGYPFLGGGIQYRHVELLGGATVNGPSFELNYQFKPHGSTWSLGPFYTRQDRTINYQFFRVVERRWKTGLNVSYRTRSGSNWEFLLGSGFGYGEHGDDGFVGAFFSMTVSRSFSF